MKKIFIFIFFVSLPLLADTNRFYHQDTNTNQEFENIYKTIKNRTTTQELNNPLNILNYGAIPDAISGTPGSGTDSFGAIQTALNTGRSIYIPKGVYRLSQSLLINSSPFGTTVFGDGDYQSILQPDNFSNGAIIIGYTSPVQYMTFRDFGILGNPTIGSGGIIIGQTLANYGANLTFQKMRIENYTGSGCFGIEELVSYQNNIIDAKLNNNYYNLWIPTQAVTTTNNFFGQGTVFDNAGTNSIQFDGYATGYSFRDIAIRTAAQSAVYVSSKVADVPSAASQSYLIFDHVWFENNNNAATGLAEFYVQGSTVAQNGPTIILSQNEWHVQANPYAQLYLNNAVAYIDSNPGFNIGSTTTTANTQVFFHLPNFLSNWSQSPKLLYPNLKGEWAAEDKDYFDSYFFQMGEWERSGTATSRIAPHGFIGEIASTATIANTAAAASGTYGNIVSTMVGSGSWLFSGTCIDILNGATISGNINCAISINSNNNTGDHVFPVNVVSGLSGTALDNSSIPVINYPLYFSSATTVYLKGLATYSAGTPQFQGNLVGIRSR